MRFPTTLSALAAVVVVATWPVFSRPFASINDPSPRPDFPPRFAAFLAGDQVPAQMSPDPPESARDVLFRFDVLLNVWTLAWGSHALATAPFRFFDSNALHPTSGALSYSDHQLGVVPWFAPFYWATGNPVFAYQAALFLSALSCGWFFALLLARWTGLASAGLAAGIVAIAAPFHQSFLRVLIHFSIQYLPAALLCVDALVAGRRRRLAAVGLVAAVTLQALCSVYMVFTTALAVGIYVLVVAAGARGDRLRACTWLAGSLLLAAFLVTAAYGPYLDHARQEWRPSAAVPYNSSLSRWWADPIGTAIVRMLTGSLGGPLLILALLGCLERDSRRRLPAATLVVTGLVLGLGPTLRVGAVTFDAMPWSWLARLVPGFALQRHPYVPTVLVGVGLTCLVGLGWAWLVARLEQRGRVARAVGVVIAMLLVAEPVMRSWLTPRHLLRLATADRVPAVYRWLASHGSGEPLLEFPLRPYSAAYQYFSTYHWLPLFNGYYALPPAGRLRLEAEAEHVLDPDRSRRFFAQVRIKWLVVHGMLLTPRQHDSLARPLPHLELVQAFGEDRLFRVRDRRDAASASSSAAVGREDADRAR